MSWEDDLQAAPGDPEAAARVLGHAAGFMRRGEALPAALAEYIAGAFEGASDHAAKDGETGVPLAKKLGTLLNLRKDKGGRPVVPVEAETAYLSAVFGEESERAIASRHGVGHRTIGNRVKAAAKQFEEEAAEQQRMIDSMTEPELAAWLADPYDAAAMPPGVQKSD